MLHKLKEIYLKEQFNPTWLGIIINPFFFSRKGLHKEISSLISQLNGKILDIGCGQKPYQNLCHTTEYVGLEIDSLENRKNKRADFYYDGKAMPFEDGFFDSIISNQVFEHVFNPDEFLREVNRVAKIKGKLLLTVPFVWDEHEQPYDYARYSSFGLKHLLEKNGFEIIQHKKTAADITVIFQLLSAYVYKVTLSKNSCFNLFIMLILIAPINIIGLLLSLILPDNDDLYLDNVILAQKINYV